MARKSKSTENVITPNILRRMLITGGKLLELNKNTVDALNVFPVPDGDTGTNMSLTMRSAIKEIYNETTNDDMAELAKKLSSGALKGARGNSGVILSQIFRGFANVIQSKEFIDTKTFAKALANGVKIAYSAVAQPKEGTMLTVARVVAEKAAEISKRSISMEDYLCQLLAEGEDILSKTPELLDVLKKAGVVDSGGYGFVVILKGFLMGYNNEEVTGAEDYIPSTVSTSSVEPNIDVYIDYDNLDEITFGYCTEFFIENLLKKTTTADIDRLREKLTSIGDSVVVVGDLSLIKVHVHTDQPGVALGFALELGELDRVKIENMRKQNRELKAKRESERKPVGLLVVCAGDGFRDIFKDLLVDQVIEGGQTMNPSADSIAQAVAKINAENVIILPNNKNIILAAEQAKVLVSNKQVFVVPSKNIPQGLAATLAYNPNASVEENVDNMNDALPSVRSGSVTYAVRSSTINDLELTKGDIIGLDGNKIVTKGEKVEEVTRQLIGKMNEKEDYEILTLYYGKDIPKERAEEFAAVLGDEYPDWEIDVHYGGQPLYYYIFSVE
ncbi:MAG: DAK2 domain-containing protein [Clostridia bacterium]|nr:DAK2 domain-containing protein [Clostridia bacterium]